MTGRPALPGRLRFALAGLLALLVAVLVQGRIEARAAGRPQVHPLLYLPSGRYLKIASLGFDSLLADLVYLWSIQYYGNYAIQDRYNNLEQIYGTVIAELDPHYLDPYLIGALIMNTEARRPEMALRLLDRGIAANPREWILAFEAGFLCYDTLHDYPRAARYFETALRTPGVHPLVRRLYAEMYARAGDKRTSLKEWAEIHRTAENDYVRNVAWNHVHDLKVEVDLETLGKAIAAFAGQRGGPPRRLEDLGALLPEAPRDPEGREYRYDPASGRVSYGGSLVLAR